MKAQRSVAVLAAIGLALTVSALTSQPAAADPGGHPAPISARGAGSIGSLRQEAQKAGILIGSGAIKAMTTTSDGRPPNYLTDPRFRQVLSTQFNSLSPENDLKWMFVEPQAGVFDFDGLDRLVSFAEANHMQVKGHGLISGCCNPDYLTAIKDPIAFRAAMVTHFNTIMQRYHGKMDRWDVVTEPLSTFGGTGLNHNDFYNVLGQDYIAEAFRIAHAADPTAKLFLNENMVEFYPEKRQELYDLVSGLVAAGVPINGVALQMHETFSGPQPGVLTDIVNSYHALGLDVSIAELDVHTYDTVSQAQIYGDVVAEALAAGVKEISTWGFTDAHLYTWLPGAKPLMFDEQYNPKSAYFAVLDALRHYVENTPLPTAPPGAGTLSVSGAGRPAHDGDRYTIKMKLVGDTPGSFYRLYENDTLVAVRGLDCTRGTAQIVTDQFSRKPAGTYVYRGELMNSKGTTSTNTLTVTVG